MTYLDKFRNWYSASSDIESKKGNVFQYVFGDLCNLRDNCKFVQNKKYSAEAIIITI